MTEQPDWKRCDEEDPAFRPRKTMTEQENIRRLAEWLDGAYIETLNPYPTKGLYRAKGNPIFIADWNPFTSSDHAWMLVEKAKSLGHDILLYYIRVNDEYCVQFSYAWDVYANTMQQAICKAVLRLMEGEK
jgi:hypothetical protein